jgi:serine/threonine-protein kinase
MASSSDRWQRLEALFYSALDLPVDARPAFLEANCADDANLRKEIESLLESAGKPLEHLQRPVLVAAQQVAAHPLDEKNLAENFHSSERALYQERHDASDPSNDLGRRENRANIPPGTLLAHYEVISLLGAGGMGQVYLARDSRLRRKVALKMLLPALTGDQRDLRRFEHEALAVSALNHPNILTIFEFGEANGRHFIASEYVEGSTLRQKIATGPLAPTHTIDIAIQIASALAAAHARGMVHRDIKPDNVIVRTDGIVKVLDFGIAKLNLQRLSGVHRTVSALAASHSEPGMVIGTARYMSPEQARGYDVDARSDIFSLGAVFFEMLTGRPAFAGATPSDVVAEVLKSDPPPPSHLTPNVPPELDLIVAKALCKDRESRYQTVKDLLAELQNLKDESEFQAKLQRGVRLTPPHPTLARPELGPADVWQRSAMSPSIAPPPIPSRASSLTPWLAAITLLLVAILAAAYFSLKKSSEPIPAHPRSLAVLPFRNLRPDTETDFLGFSLADAVITKLGYVGALNVRPSSSVDKYRNQVIDPKQVAIDLNVDTLLTGTYIKDGNDLRITTQLIDVKPDKILWRESIDLKYDKLLTVQDRVTQQIINGLELNLSPREAANLKPEKTIDTTAYEYYLRGIDLYSMNNFTAAIQVLQKATFLEPKYAPAWAHLGRAYTTNASLQFGGREDYNKAQAAYEKAIALNPALVEPRIYMANLFTDTGRVEQAVPLLRSVLHDSPNNAEAHWELGYAYRFAGMLPESVAECEQARQYNPLVKINSAAFNSYLYLGQYDKFLQTLPTNDSVYITFYHGFAEYHLGKLQQAAADFDRAYAKDPSLLPADVGKALSYAIQHDNKAGLTILHQTEARIEERGVTDPEGFYKVAQAYAVLGDKAGALHMLSHTIAGGFFCYPYFMRDPLMQTLHSSPEFQSLLTQALNRHTQFQTLFYGQ